MFAFFSPFSFGLFDGIRYFSIFSLEFSWWFSRLFSIWDSKGAKEYYSDRSRQELSKEYLVAKIGFDTAENEPLKVRITDHTFDPFVFTEATDTAR